MMNNNTSELLKQRSIETINNEIIVAKTILFNIYNELELIEETVLNLGRHYDKAKQNVRKLKRTKPYHQLFCDYYLEKDSLESLKNDLKAITRKRNKLRNNLAYYQNQYSNLLQELAEFKP